MNNEIVKLYSGFKLDKMTVFFDDLIDFINKHEEAFSRFTVEDSLEIIKTFKAENFIVGTSDYDFKDGLPFYSEKMKEATEQEICHNVMDLLWDMAAFTTKELCPSCTDDYLKVASSIDRAVIYKVCDNCLVTLLDDRFIESPCDVIPATKPQVDSMGVY